MKIAAALSTAIAILATAVVASPDAQAQTEPHCDIDRTIVFAGLDWDSAQFHNAVARHILEHGYGCRTDAIPGSTLPLLAGMGRGDIDVTMEIWTNNVPEAWKELRQEGKVAEIGTNFRDAEQGWFVPHYLVEGPDAPAPDLESVFDLPQYKDLFTDPERPDKGRFYNCILGWACEEVNTKKLEAYGLADDFTNFRPGTGAALAAVIASNYKRREPFLAYYWTPTWVAGQFDLVRLEEPEYDPEIWEAMIEESDPDQATAYPTSEVVVGVNAAFQEAAPQTIAMLEAYETTSAIVSDALGFMQETGGTVEEAALKFLRENEDLWTGWVPEDVAERVKASL